MAMILIRLLIVIWASFVFSLFRYNVAYCSDLQIREDSKFFVRLNLKLNSMDDTKIFAYAIGYRVNFDLRKSKKSRMYSDGGIADAYFHPDHIRESTKWLFNSYGWNGTACVARTMCEIQQLGEFSSDILGPALKLLYFASKNPISNKRFCLDGIHCPISIFHSFERHEIF